MTVSKVFPVTGSDYNPAAHGYRRSPVTTKGNKQMTHYDISYAKLSGAEADAKALKDIKSYLGSKGWLNLMELTAKETRLAALWILPSR